MKLTRRFLALLLAFSMSLSMVTPAFASEVETVAETEAEAVVEEIAAVEAEAVNETAAGATEASTEGSEESTEGSEESTEGSDETTEGSDETTEGSDETTVATEETEPAGTSEDNPIWPEWTWNDAQTEASVTVTVPAGETCYVAITFGGLQMTVNGGELTETTGSFMMPQILELTNDGEEAADYEVVLTLPAGTMSNPEVLSELTWVDVSLAEGDEDGYYYTYTAEGDGTATFYIGSITEGVEADIVIYNQDTYVQKSLLADGVDNYGLEVTIDVNAGDLLSIQVVVPPDMDNNWNIAAADISWVGSFTYAAGTEQNPIFPEFVWNEAQTEATATVTAPVGTTYYAVYGGGLMLSINNGVPTLLVAQGIGRAPAVFSITNEGEAAAEYSLVLTYPDGSSQNPEVLYGLGTSYTTQEAGDYDGYYYTYTVENDGVLEFTLDSVTEGVVADITVNKEGSYTYYTLAEDGVEDVLSLEVTAGDILIIQVAAIEDASGNYNPAADIQWTVNYPVGTELNPLFPEFVMNDEYTEGEATITVPANTTYFCASYSAGMVLTINGGDEQLLKAEGMGRVPAYFTVTNDTDADAEFVLHISYPAGHQMNPEVLYGLGGGYASLEAGDYDGYYYTFTVENDGVLEFSINSVTEGVEADVAVMNMNTYAQRSITADGVDGVASIVVTAGDVLSIQVVAMPDADWNVPAADVDWSINYPVGTELNPLYPEFVMNDEYTEGEATITVPANTTYFCASYSAGMILTINGTNEQLLVAEGMGRVPAYFTVTNDTDADAEFVLHIAYPDGHQMNPEELYWLGGNYTSLEAGDNDGYYYTYTAEADGTLEFSITSVTEGVEADVSVVNENTYAQRSVVYDAVKGVASIDVTAGDVLAVQVVALPGADWTVPAADVEWTINYTLGHELNPIYPEFVMDENNEIDHTVTVPANTTYYYAAYGIGGMLMSINGGEPVEMVAQGIGRVPVTFSITNDTDAEAEYVLHLEYPVGNQMNPADLLVYTEGESWDESEGLNIATVKEGDWYGYNYTWIAPADGELTITMSNGKAGWFYVINNMTNGVYGDNHYSCNDDAISETISVSAGDEIVITVNSCGASEYDITPAGDVYFNAYFAKTTGIDSNPAYVEFEMNEDYTEGTATVTVPANTTYYFQAYNVGGMELYVDGVLNQILPTAMRGAPVVFTLTNDTAEDAEWALFVSYPAGSQMKPAELLDGETTVSLAAGTQGYNFTYTAPDRGTVTFEIAAAEEMGWFYVINNMTTYSYGDNQWSDSNPVVNPAEISVNKGDELQIIVNTYDAASPWAAPAGDVTVNVSFLAAEGTETSPAFVEFIMNEDYTKGSATVTVPAYSTYYFQSYGIGGMILSVNGVEAETLPVTMGRMPVTFSVTNDTEADAEYALSVSYSAGHMMNPTEMTLGQKTSAEIEAGSQGYWFAWTATGNGVLEFTMSTKTGWSYQLNNDNTYASTDIRWSDDNPLVKKDYLAVNKGDVVKILVNTYDPENPWSAPAGKIEFTTKLIVSYNSTLLAGKNATLKYLDDAGKTVSAGKVEWTIAMADGPEVPATITLKNGKLTAAKTIAEPTTVIVTGTYEGVAQQFTVTIYPAATSVTIYDANGNDVSGKSLLLITNKPESWPTLTAVVAPEGTALSEVTWKSSSTKVVDVVDGVITPVGNKGNATITATAADGSGKKATVKIVVTTEVTSIDITSKTGFNTVGAGKALTLIATTNKDAVNQKVDWSITSGAEYATINSSGKLTANKGLTEMHEVTVVATAKDGSGVTGTYTAAVLPIASSVVIKDAPATADLSGWPYAYLGAEVLDAEGNVISYDVTWKSSSDKIATVDQYGTVEFLKTGNVTITATANDGSNKKATLKISVVKSPWLIDMPTEEIIAAGKTLTLKPDVLDADASNKKLTWTISENSIGAKVSNGKVSCNAKLVTEPTTVTVTATAQIGNAEPATCDVTFYPATKTVSIMSNGAAVGKSVNLSSGDSIVLYAENAPANAAGRYTWTSSNENIAAVEYNPDGSVTVKVHALKTTKATITATAVDGTNKKATVTLNVVADVDALGLESEVVLSGKSFNMNSNLFFLDWNPEYENYDVVTPVSKTVTWTLSLADYSDGTGRPTFIPQEGNTCYAGTLDAKTGMFKAAKVTEAAYCFVTATYIDAEGNEIVSNGAQITVTPVALKGIDILGCEGTWNEDAVAKITGKTVTTTAGRYVLDVEPTNPDTDAVNYMWGIELSDWENFWIDTEVIEVEVDGETHKQNYPVIVPVEDGDPYGTVKVTIIAEGGATKKASTTIVFAEP